MTNTVNRTNNDVGAGEEFVKPSFAVLSAAVMKEQGTVQFFYQISKMRCLPEPSAYI